MSRINSKYNKLETESLWEYGLRLIEIKVDERPEDLDWQDIIDMVGLDCHRDSLRKAANVTEYSGYEVAKYFKEKISQMQKEMEYQPITAATTNVKVGYDYSAELDKKTIEFKKERQRFFDQRAAFNKLIRERARQEEINDIVRDAIKSAIEASPQHDMAVDTTVFQSSDNDLLASLNDLHFGAWVDNHWNQYDSEQCQKMLKQYLNEIVEIKKLHNSDECYVWANGDLISGNIHKSIAVSNRENVIQQLTGVAELIAAFLNELSHHFNKVTFLSVAGNHSRIERKEDALLAERLDMIVPWYLEGRFMLHPKIKIASEANFDPTMYEIKIRGKRYIGIHGDYDFGDTGIMKLSSMVGGDIYAVLTAHLHHNAFDSVQNIKVIMAGGMLGVDDLCVTRRILGVPQQMITIVTSKGIKGLYPIDFE